MLAAVLCLLVVAVLLWPPRAGEGTSRGGLRGGATTPSTMATPGSSGGDDDPTVDAAADALVLCALALRSGLAPVESLDAVADPAPSAVAHHLRVVASAQRWGQDASTAWAHVGEGWRSASLAWQAAERSGAAPSGVVLAAARRMRREESTRVEAAVQRAGVLLVLPLGACFLPGFVGTTVVPIVLHLARTSLAPPG